MNTSRTDVLSSIETKLGALLALAIADRLPQTAKARARPLDQILADGGLTTVEIASLMGKSRQAVQQVLSAGKSKTSSEST